MGIFRIHAQVQEVQGATGITSVQLFNPPQAIYITKFADITEKNLIQFQQVRDGRVLVRLDQTGTRLLEALTSNSMGKMIVIIVNGRVVYSPKVDIPLREGALLLPSNSISEEDIILMVQTMKYLARR
ncbi:MAG: hypothetical protein AAF984_07735 [Verrucomicrobiota bacterium]